MMAAVVAAQQRSYKTKLRYQTQNALREILWLYEEHRVYFL